MNSAKMAKLIGLIFACLQVTCGLADAAPLHDTKKNLSPHAHATSANTDVAREGIFVLKAARASISSGKLLLAGIGTNVLALEPTVKPPAGVSESADRFLERWTKTDHSMTPTALLMSHTVTSADAYRTLSLQIDRPTKGNAGEWLFDVAAVDGKENDFPDRMMDLTDVTITVAMSHSPEEFELGHVCGPWTPELLKSHKDISK